MAWYVTGLLLDGDRKSTAPMAARLVDDPARAGAMRETLQQCVSDSPWSENLLLEGLTKKFMNSLPGVAALVIDDTGFPKKGTHSVGVARQYSGTLGRVENCQVAVSLHVAGESTSGCIGMRLYLPDEWASDRDRCRAAGVPDSVVTRPKWKIALDLIDQAQSWDVPKLPVLADGAYGDCTDFREALDQRELPYVLRVAKTTRFWLPGTGPVPAEQRADGQGRPRTRWTDGDHSPQTVLEIAQGVGRSAYRLVTWREGSRGKQRSRIAAVRVRCAHRHRHGRPPGKEEWLICEWPSDAKQPTRFWLSTLPKNTPLKSLVWFAMLRWRIERDYQEMKQEIGLDHFEGRGWRGFHHHATLCAVAHGFLALQRALFPPEPP